MNNEKFNPGPIVLMGSGETSPNSGAVYEEVARGYPSPLRVSILETPAGFENNSERVAGRVGEFLQIRLQNYHPIINIIPARKKGTAFSPDSEEILEPLFHADMIFMGPGSPTYAARQLKNSLAYEIIQAKHRTGSALVLASAATIAFGCQTLPVYEIHKAGMDLHWQPGLNFFEQYGLSLVIIPHWNNSEGGAELDTSHCFMGNQRFNALKEILDCKGLILGIDEHTSLWLDLGSEKASVFGKGYVHLEAPGEERSFSAGETILLRSLGDYISPVDFHQGIRASVWEKIEQVKIPEQAKIDEIPPETINALLMERESARKNTDFALADTLRHKIEASGWKISDTPTGPKLVKI